MKNYYCIGLFILLISACSSEDEATFDCILSDLNFEVVSQTTETCSSLATIELSPIEGLAPYTYSVDGISFQESNVFSSLVAGVYSVIVRDGNDCTISQEVTVVSDKSLIELTTETVQNAGCGGSQGSVTIDIFGGTTPYALRVDGEDVNSQTSLTGLSNGNHLITIADAEGCEIEETFYIASGVSYINEIQSIIETNCSIIGCHVSGTNRSDLSQLSNLQAFSSNVRSRTQSRNMPPSDSGRSLTDDEIDLIACWVDDGALDN